MPRAALYARVSTTDQRLDAQLDTLRSYASARGLEVVAEHVDHGVSGVKARRPALDRLVAQARRRAFDVVVCTKLDRLARSVRHLVNVTAELEALGVDLVVLDQAIDTSTPAGRFLFNTLGAVAELERDLIRERVVAGMQAAKRRGRHVGRAPALNSDQLARLRRLHAAGQSQRAIAGMLGIGKGTVARALARLRLDERGDGEDRSAEPNLGHEPLSATEDVGELWSLLDPVPGDDAGSRGSEVVA